jgi:YbbR domain-containing protein
MANGFFKDIWLKLGAIFLALLLWFHVITDRPHEHVFSCDLKVVNIPDNLIVYEEIPQEVKFSVEGRGKTLIRLFLSQKGELIIDGTDFRPRDINYRIKPEEINLPVENLEVKEIVSPKSFKIKLDFFRKKKVKVVPQIVINPDDEFLFFGDIKLQPEEVEVAGPRRIVQTISSVLTESKVIELAREPVSESVDLIPPEGFNVKCEPEKVNFFANVQPGVKREMMVKIADLNSTSQKNIKINPDHVNLTLLGEEKKINSLKPEEVLVTLDIKSTKGKYKFPPIVKLPPQIKLISVKPDSLEVEIN